MIAEDYVSFEVAKLLKEKGFNESCHATYDTAVIGGKPKFSEYEVLSFFPYGMRNTDDKYSMVISAPTQSMAMKWLREVHNKHCDVGYDIDLKWFIQIIDLTESVEHNYPENRTGFKSYEEAVEAAIKYCLENLI